MNSSPVVANVAEPMTMLESIVISSEVSAPAVITSPGVVPCPKVTDRFPMLAMVTAAEPASVNSLLEAA